LWESLKNDMKKTNKQFIPYYQKQYEV